MIVRLEAARFIRIEHWFVRQLELLAAWSHMIYRERFLVFCFPCGI